MGQPVGAGLLPGSREREKHSSRNLEDRMDLKGREEEGARVLIVDDDRSMLEVLSEILSAMGFCVSTANGSREGLSMFLTGSFDLVFTDLNMPGMDGWSLASHIKNKSPKTPVVLITGEMEREVRAKLEGSCVDKALFKPFTLAEVIGVAHGMLSKRSH